MKYLQCRVLFLNLNFGRQYYKFELLLLYKYITLNQRLTFELDSS